MRMRLHVGALVFVTLALTAVSGEKFSYRNDEGNTCEVYYRFKRAMCGCGDQCESNGKVSILH